jgi:hypothetical protein
LWLKFPGDLFHPNEWYDVSGVIFYFLEESSLTYILPSHNEIHDTHTIIVELVPPYRQGTTDQQKVQQEVHGGDTIKKIKNVNLIPVLQDIPMCVTVCRCLFHNTVG